jgi:hypothetical protein
MEVEIHVLQTQRPIADGRGLLPRDQIVHPRQHRDHQPSVVEHGMNGRLQIAIDARGQ